MKKLRKIYEEGLDKLEAKWSALSLAKQRKSILWIFLGYVSLTGGMLFHAWYGGGTPVVIDHIENPVLRKKDPAQPLQDSLSIILKKKMHESKGK